jgi:mRNA-degrading endonuclease RelE of RelBE toxin-antitoxin system
MRWFTIRQQRTVLDTVDRQAPWELRIGDLRVYYETKDEPEPIVTILAIGIKERDQVRIGGERFKL